MPINLNLPKNAGLFITGTGGGAGKTLVAGGVARILTDKGLKAGVFKPIATGCHRTWEGPAGCDTEFLAWCSNSELPLSTITPVGFLNCGVPLAASALEGTVVDFNKITAAYEKVCESCDIVIVEGFGGVRVPLTAEFDLLDLAVEFSLPMVLVARRKSGMINQTLMSVDCIRAAGLEPAGIVVNAYNAIDSTPADEAAEGIIEHCASVQILSVLPFDETVSIEEPSLGELILDSLADCDWEKLAQV